MDDDGIVCRPTRARRRELIDQREKQAARQADCQSRFLNALRCIKNAHAELEQLGKAGPWIPIVYTRLAKRSKSLGAPPAASPRQAHTQRGGDEGKSVLPRGDVVHAAIVKHIMPIATQTFRQNASGTNWSDTESAVNAHVDALMNQEPGLNTSDKDLLQAALHSWRWSCPQNPDVLLSSVLRGVAIASFSVAKTLDRPAASYPQNRAEQRSRKE